jgi:hypothetical protein
MKLKVRSSSVLLGVLLSLLVEGYWYQAYAYQRGIKYTNADLQSGFKKAVRTEFNVPGAFVKHLKKSGETRLQRLRLGGE